jgi:hypothetical protein
MYIGKGAICKDNYDINPYGFNADSLIERLTKRKDHGKMKAFIKVACGL